MKDDLCQNHSPGVNFGNVQRWKCYSKKCIRDSNLLPSKLQNNIIRKFECECDIKTQKNDQRNLGPQDSV
jgi:hypothetical protein